MALEFRTPDASIRDEAGRPVVLHGANLPTLTEMAASPYKPANHLRDLANAGAKIVRLRVTDSEITPTFVPGPVTDFVRQANRLGLLVMLAWGDTIQTPLNQHVNDAERWLRLMIDYLKNNPGVWFDPVDAIHDASSRRQRPIAQRFVDVARGRNANNIIVINQPDWLTDPDPDARQLLSGVNVVYGIDVETMNRYPLDAAPFMFTRWPAFATLPPKTRQDKKHGKTTDTLRDGAGRDRRFTGRVRQRAGPGPVTVHHAGSDDVDPHGHPGTAHRHTRPANQHACTGHHQHA
ncbi:MAG: cellulase family glycosylhydrolase [Candidatus Roseilinea sp.]|uniref:cellulase family glycosylhydrolase n=1 Tax=Candidatus Roseilinea sp. TaxID=2838777 RepID=UPI00404ADD02